MRSPEEQIARFEASAETYTGLGEWSWKSLRGGGIEVGLWFGRPLLDWFNSADEFGGEAVLLFGWLSVRISYNNGADCGVAPNGRSA